MARKKTTRKRLTAAQWEEAKENWVYRKPDQERKSATTLAKELGINRTTLWRKMEEEEWHKLASAHDRKLESYAQLYYHSQTLDQASKTEFVLIDAAERLAALAAKRTRWLMDIEAFVDEVDPLANKVQRVVETGELDEDGEEEVEVEWVTRPSTNQMVTLAKTLGMIQAILAEARGELGTSLSVLIRHKGIFTPDDILRYKEKVVQLQAAQDNGVDGGEYRDLLNEITVDLRKKGIDIEEWEPAS